MSSRARKGFTLVEMVVSLALIGIFAGTTVPHMQRMVRRSELRRAATDVVGNVSKARTMAGEGSRMGSPWGVGDRTLNAGIQVLSPTSYVVFADRDSVTDGDEIVVRTVLLPQGMAISTPAVGSIMRFRQNGTIVTPLDFTILDQTLNISKTVTVAGGGFARVN